MAIFGFALAHAHQRLDTLLGCGKPITLFYHGVDNDGAYGKAVLSHYLTTHFSDVEFRAVGINYGQPIKPEDVEGRAVIFVDYSPTTQEDVALIMTKAEEYMIIDHHRTSLQKFLNHANEMDLMFYQKANDHLFFDFENSGALLAERICFPEKKVSGIIRYVHDRDLFAKKLPLNDEVHLLLNAKRIVGEEDEIYRDFHHLNTQAFLKEIAKEGIDMGELKNIHDERIAQLTRKFTVAKYMYGQPYQEHMVAVINNTDHSLTSDLAASILAEHEEIDMVAIITKIDFAKSLYHVGLRSREVDVSEVAMSLDARGEGGGHPRASGCRVHIRRFSAEFNAIGVYPNE